MSDDFKYNIDLTHKALEVIVGACCFTITKVPSAADDLVPMLGRIRDQLEPHREALDAQCRVRAEREMGEVFDDGSLNTMMQELDEIVADPQAWFDKMQVHMQEQALPSVEEILSALLGGGPQQEQDTPAPGGRYD